MRNPGGYATLRYQDNDRVVECDTYTCGHCGAVTHVPPKCDPAELGGMCFCCNTLICKKCVGIDGCVSLDKRLDSEETRKSYGNF